MIIMPTIGLKGKYTFKDPFTLSNDLTLRATAVRTISDYIEVGRNVMVDVYVKAGLTREDYLNDKLLDMPIVTFVTLQQKTITVPASYITKLPSVGTDSTSSFAWFQAITSLGLLPVGFDVTAIEEAIKVSVSEYIGIEPVVFVTVAETLDDIDIASTELAEETRKASITYKSTAYKDKVELENKLAAARAHIEQLILVIEDMKTTP